MTSHPLEALQLTDTHLAQLRHRRSHSDEAATVTRLDGAIVEVHGRRTTVAATLAAIEAREAQHESELATIDARLATIDRQLKTADAKTADALNHERDTQRGRADHLSDEILSELDEAEGPTQQLAQLDGELAQLAADRVDALAALTAALAAIDADVAVHEEIRATQQLDVDSALLAKYDRLRARLGGVALARLDGARCTGCHVTLASGEVQQLRHQPSDELVECPECERLLVR
jgi:uncharacterized protein